VSACNPQIHVGDIGTLVGVVVEEFDETTGTCVSVDISAAESMSITITRPDGTKFSRTAVFTTDGTDGQMHILSVAGDFDAANARSGKAWRRQGYVVLEAGVNEKRTEVVWFEVAENL